jgi:hypothetical protein
MASPCLRSGDNRRDGRDGKAERGVSRAGFRRAAPSRPRTGPPRRASGRRAAAQVDAAIAPPPSSIAGAAIQRIRLAPVAVGRRTRIRRSGRRGRPRLRVGVALDQPLAQEEPHVAGESAFDSSIDSLRQTRQRKPLESSRARASSAGSSSTSSGWTAKAGRREAPARSERRARRIIRGHALRRRAPSARRPRSAVAAVRQRQDPPSAMMIAPAQIQFAKGLM